MTNSSDPRETLAAEADLLAGGGGSHEKRCLARCAEALRAPIAAQVVPGWRMVPIELTDEMIALRQRVCVYLSEEDRQEDAENLREAWSDLLAAAPPPPSSCTKEGGERG